MPLSRFPPSARGRTAAVEGFGCHRRRNPPVRGPRPAQSCGGQRPSRIRHRKTGKALDDSDKEVQRHAARAVAQVRPANARATTILLATRKDLGLSSKDLLADLERLSPHNGEARKALIQMLTNDNAETARDAYRTLNRLELPGDNVREAWTCPLSHADNEVRSEAIRRSSEAWSPRESRETRFVPA